MIIIGGGTLLFFLLFFSGSRTYFVQEASEGELEMYKDLREQEKCYDAKRLVPVPVPVVSKYVAFRSGDARRLYEASRNK